MLPTLAVALHMVIHSPLKQLGLDSAVYIGLPGQAPNVLESPCSCIVEMLSIHP